MADKKRPSRVELTDLDVQGEVTGGDTRARSGDVEPQLGSSTDNVQLEEVVEIKVN